MSGVLHPSVPRRSRVTVLVAVLLVTALLTVPLLGLADDQPGEPINFFGTAEDEDGTPVPEGTTLVAVIDGEVEDEITVDEAGAYGGPAVDDDALTINTGAGDEVTFHVDRPEGPQASETYEIPDETPTERVEFNLTFPADGFEPAELSLDLAAEELTVDETTQAAATVIFGDGSQTDVTADATFEVTDDDVVTVADDGTVTAEADGETTITAEFDGLSDTATVTVAEEPEDEPPEDDEPEDDDPAPAPAAPAPSPPAVVGDPGPPDGVEVLLEVGAPLQIEDGQSRAVFDEGPVRSVAFDIAVSGDVIVRELDRSPAVEPPGEPVSVSQVVVPRGAETVSATLEKAAPREEVDEAGVDPDAVTVLRLVDGDWERLETTVDEVTDEVVIADAATPRFSVFAATALEAPTAAFDVEPAEPTVGEELTLDASPSTPADEIVTYEWTINGQTVTGETVTTTPDEAGDLTVELTVENELEETDTVTQTIEVAAVDEDDEPEDDEPVDDEPEDDEPEDDAVPGFGVAVAALALLSAALLARMRS